MLPVHLGQHESIVECHELAGDLSHFKAVVNLKFLPFAVGGVGGEGGTAAVATEAATMDRGGGSVGGGEQQAAWGGS